MATQIQLRRGTAAEWTAANPVLAEGEMGIELDTSNFKIGNGVNTWSALDYGFSALPGGGDAGQILAKDSNASFDFVWIDNYTEELSVTIKNDTGSTLTKGQVVTVNGASGGKLTVALAQANSESTSAGTIGLVKANISNGATGSVIITGSLKNIDTNGLTAGAPLFLSPDTAGAWTATKPTGADHLVVIGFVENVNSSTGALFVKTENFPEIYELTGTLIDSTPADGDVLTYETATGLWTNKEIPASTLASLTDVDLTGLDDTYILRYDAATTSWKAEVLPTGVQDLDDLTDVDLTTPPTNGQVLAFNDTTDQWEPYTLPTDVVGATTLEELNDVEVDSASLTEGQYLRWAIPTEGPGYWIADDLTIPTIDTLGDVDLTTPPTDGQVLIYVAATDTWVPSTVSGSGAGYPTITTATKTTASIATGANEKSTITITQGYRLLKVETDVAARVRLYTTTTGRDADEARAFVTEPDANNGVLFDYITTSGDLSNDLSPTVDGFVTTGTAIPITVTNLSGSTGTVTVTLTYVRTI